MKIRSWHDDMKVVWVTEKNRDRIKGLRDKRLKIKTAEDVIDMLIETFETHVQQCNLADLKPRKTAPERP
jgi:hypothetical protein